MRRQTGTALAAIATALALATGCGGSEKKEKPAVPAETPINDPALKPAKSGAPSGLLGQYTVRLAAGDLPSNPPEELTKGSETWTVTLAETGGPGEGPGLTITNDQLGPLESSNFEVKGDRILVHEQECAAGEPVESVYGFEQKGDQLTLTREKGGCSDEVATTILTAKPLKKKG